MSMRNEEPLEEWLMYVELAHETSQSRRQQGERENRAALKELARAIKATSGKIDFSKVRGGYITRFRGAGLAPKDTPEAQRIYMELWERGGAGASYTGAGLLEGIALALSPATVPFWQQLLDLTKPRDRHALQRRIYAMAALALLAIGKEDAPAETAIVESLQHENEHVRELAIFYLVWVMMALQKEPGAHVLAALAECATEDRAFGPRYQARSGLRMLDRPLPLENEDHVYFFNVQLGKHPATRLIGIRAEQTLEELHYAIQRAFNWDADHLYSFFLNGKLYDERFEIAPPEPDLGMFAFALSDPLMIEDGDDEDAGEDGDGEVRTTDLVEMIAGAKYGLVSDGASDEAGDEDDEDEDDGALLNTATAQIGDLGLRPKHSLRYYFDYGDSHEFSVKLVAIEPRFDDDPYPRVFEAHGEAPEQYPSYDEDWEEDS
ncbi:MAG: plasmid pRiA4b ORF-3 family protein [Oscillochloris sp.]|nr:plasmid pRiA4b ORF-3 family protein [Oscillochloris sp.]